MSDQTLKQWIEDAIGDAAVAQNIIDLANNEGVNLDDVVALLEKNVSADQIKQWLQDGVKLDGAATLLDQGIDSHAAIQLINNKADLRDIATNSRIILNAGVRVDLVNGWLDNRSHLNDAIAIINLGIDINLIGTSSKMRDFTGLTGATPNEIVSRIPVDAKIEHWTPEPERIEKGMEFRWQDTSGKTWIVRMHEADPHAPAGSHAATGWILRVRYGKKFMDATGKLYTDNALTKPISSKYDPDGANKTHIPIQAPSGK